MSITKFARKRRLISIAMATAFVGGVFQANGCSINLDQATLTQLATLLSNLNFSGSGHISVGPATTQGSSDGMQNEHDDNGNHHGS